MPRLAALHPLVAATLLAALTPAQNPDGPYWSSYPKPTGVTLTRLLGSEFIAQTPNAVHCYSGITRGWTVIPTTTVATLTITNDYLIAQDGNTFHAWSARTGTVQSLSVSPTAVLNPGSVSSSWVCYVLDGNTIHGYSAFFGQWVPLQLQGGAQTTGVGSHALTAVDAVNAYGFSAFFGTWERIPVAAGGTYTTFRNGCVATFTGPDEVKAFSSYTNTWVTAPLLGIGGATVNLQDAYGLITTGGGVEVLGFGVLHGTLTRLLLGIPATIVAGPEVAVLVTPSNTVGFAPGRDAFVNLPLAPVSGVRVATGSFGCYALIDTGTSLTAFSGLTGGTASAPLYEPFTWSLGDTAAYGRNQSRPLDLAYSALQGRWVLGTPGATILDVKPAFESILLQTPTGWTAFCARTATFNTLTTAATQLVYQQAGALQGIVDTNGVDVHDPVLGRWAHVTTGSNPVLSTWRLTGIVSDGAVAYGYCLFNNVWESIPLIGSVVTFRAQDLVGYVETTSHFFTYSANGSLTNFARFPEFSRFIVRGAPLQHVQSGTPGNFVVGMFGTVPIEQPVPPFGTLRVNPSSAVIVGLGTIPASGLLRVPILIPNDPNLTGLQLVVQDIVVPPSGNLFLTNAQQPYIW